jgi:hypothetical protein
MLRCRAVARLDVRIVVLERADRLLAAIATPGLGSMGPLGARHGVSWIVFRYD